MGPFALPVPSWKQGQHHHKRRKIEEKETPADAPSVENPPSPEEESVRTPTSSHLHSDTINPRSHSPNTLRQLVVAGLSPDEELPSQQYPSFPHKALPADYFGRDGRNAGRRSRSRSRSKMSALTSGSEADADDTDASGSTVTARRWRGRGRNDEDAQAEEEEERLAQEAHASPARIRHLGTMLAILHRCLHTGDVPRARRAFSLLLQTRDVDVRLNGMWTLGAEILMRNGETADGHQHGGRRGERGEQDETAEGDDGEGEGDDASRPPPPRWGSAANIDKVRDYLSSLIQQHPYDAHLPRLTSAVDFWPALYNIEIYNIDAEFRRALFQADEEQEQREQEEGQDPSLLSDGPNEDEYRSDNGEGGRDEDEDAYEARFRRREARRQMARHVARDAVRRETRAAAMQIAARMDTTMESPPYMTHVELLRLRGLLAMFIGDLWLPSRLLEEASKIGSGGVDDDRDSRDDKIKTSSREDREFWRRREEEIDRARMLFERLIEKGGVVEPRLLRFLDLHDE